jgi:hypothetical protein
MISLITDAPQLLREKGKTALRKEGRLRRAVVSFDKAVDWHVDGQLVQPRDRAEIAVEPNAFRMTVIRGCPY